jgi:site-specific recombinase XerD
MGQLQDRMAEDLRLRNFSPATCRNYLLYARRFAKFHGRSPADLGEAEVRAFLLHQVEVRHLAYDSYRQIYAALKFLYAVTLGRPWAVEHIPHPRPRDRRLPVVLAAVELTAFFAAVRRPKYRALFMACYAAGLRINEACHLRAADIDSKQMVLHVRHPKGGRERLTLLSPRLLQELRAYWLGERPRDWLFPGDTPADPLSTDAARQAFGQAARAAGLTQHCTPHTLRHCFATHLLDAGADLVVLQALLGHRSLRSTTRYTHVTTRRLRQIVSPLDLLPVVPAGTGIGPLTGEG